MPHIELLERIVKLTLFGLGASIPVGAATFFYAAAIEPDWIDLHHEHLTLPRLSPHFDGYRIVQLSDIHAGAWLPDPRLARVIELVNDQRPDLIAITGDFVTRTYRKAPSDLVPPLGQLLAKDGVVGILGNHDYWGRRGSTFVRNLMRICNIRDLSNGVVTLTRDGSHLHIAGVDSAREGRARLSAVLDKLPPEGAAILLAHEPDFADHSAPTGRFDLQLSGHSHGGQVVFPLIGSPVLPPMGRKYWRGRYQLGNMTLYVNRGIGMVGMPFRFRARPEITVFTLHSPQAS